MYVIGINAYHADSSACIMREGQLLAAVEEERFRRIKHWSGFPSESIRYCLKEAKINLADVQHIAINSNPGANFLNKLFYVVRHRPDFSLILNRLRNRGQRAGIKEELRAHFPDEHFSGQTHRIEHHAAHLASCFNVSPYDKAVAVSVDGFGDFSSAAWGIGCNGKVDIKNRVCFPHSLGIFYQALTQYLGFPNYGDEYKVMGLAPYGEPRYLNQLRQVVHLQKDGGFTLNLKFFRHTREKIKYEWSHGSPEIGDLFSTELDSLLGLQREPKAPLEQKHKDLARSIQAMYEEAFLNLLNKLHEQYKIDALVLSGGCAMNSVANGKVKKNTPFKQIYIQSAAGDAGGAIGAAAIVSHQNGESKNRFVMNHAYWGPKFSDTDFSTLLKEKSTELQSQNCLVTQVPEEEELCRQTATFISEGKVIGWFQGRMEWGPRALGNRSILGDPRRSDMKDILNLKIKRRESFRPFAPSVLREAVPEWFEQDDEVPFMMQVYPIRQEKRNLIPAVTHVDGSGRLQTVCSETNPRYHKLITAYCNITNVPMVLNTSFNENEPVVCNPQEALSCFLRTKMDVLVLGNWIIERREDADQ